jgi:phage gp46-like protein
VIDVALVPTGETLDLELEAGDLRHENGLTTSVLVSLFSDGLAAADDELPDLGSDRRGWWAAEVLEEDRGRGFGSLLWLLERGKLQNETLVEAEAHASSALAWLVEDGIAERVQVSASRLDRSTMLLAVTLIRGAAVERADLWTAQLALSLEVGPMRFDLVAVP